MEAIINVTTTCSVCGKPAEHMVNMKPKEGIHYEWRCEEHKEEGT